MKSSRTGSIGEGSPGAAYISSTVACYSAQEKRQSQIPTPIHLRDRDPSSGLTSGTPAAVVQQSVLDHEAVSNSNHSYRRGQCAPSSLPSGGQLACRGRQITSSFALGSSGFSQLHVAVDQTVMKAT